MPNLHDPCLLENLVWILNRMPSGVPPDLIASTASPVDGDLSLVERVMKAYQKATAEFQATSGFWDEFHQTLKGDIHAALLGSDMNVAAALLRDPASNRFFWGFDAIACSVSGQPEPTELVLRRLNKSLEMSTLYALTLCDALMSLAEAVGAKRVDYPEIDIDATLASRSVVYDINGLIDQIESVLGITLKFPNPFRNELGLPSKRGIIGYRAIQSVYQAWRIAGIAGRDGRVKVLEIGAGLGRTAYFANLFGVTNYTIVDIPMTNAAQGYFLGRVLGDQHIDLYGETSRGGLRLISSTAMATHVDKYDLIVNVDSWTEMAPEIALMYWDFARRATNTVLSINHEFNPRTVRDLYKNDPQVRVLRYPYPMRRGYVEEWLTW